VYLKVFILNIITFAHFTSMQGAALGLTCKDAFQVFSQNETLALQAQVKELKALLAHHRPPIPDACKKMDIAKLFLMVRTMFDNLHPPDSRLAPVTNQDQAEHPLDDISIWSNMNHTLLDMQDDLIDMQEEGVDMQAAGLDHTSLAALAVVEAGHAHNSLVAVIKQVLKNALGDICTEYCDRQSAKAITAVELALLHGYQSSGWTIFSVQQRQENIVWATIFFHFREMRNDLIMWNNEKPL